MRIEYPGAASVAALTPAPLAAVDVSSSRRETYRLWRRYASVPSLLFLLVAGALALTPADLWIARTFFFDAAHGRWIGAESWWTNELIHVGGRWAVRGVIAGALLLWIAARVRPDLRALQRPAGYFTVAMLTTIGVVGLLKAFTNVDCPWDLTDFGGHFPFVHLFADRPDDLRRAQCFPAAHSSSGYALLALFFVARERSARLARLMLGIGLGAGLIFGAAQQARGAHFVSHDIWSVFLAWMISLSLYAFRFKGRLWG